MAEEVKKSRREEELVEAALAAAAAALFVSSVKKLVPVFVAQWPAALLATAPSPALFLLLNVIIASIVVVSVQPKRTAKGRVEVRGEDTKKVNRRRRSKRREVVADCMSLVVKDDGVELEEAGNAEEVNKRAEEFISAFRHHLRVDSFSSAARRGGAKVAACC